MSNSYFNTDVITGDKEGEIPCYKGIIKSKNFICYFVIFLTKALQNRFRYVKMGTVK